MRRIVELRIHGVSGTPPQDMLQRDVDHPLTEKDLVQVAGDRQTAFYRVAADPTGGTQANHIREAYSWGQLTSGSWTTSLWMVLVPFGLINAAHFMLPRTANMFGSLCRIASEAMLRLIGLIATVVLTLATAEVLVDLIAWQWTGLHAKDSTTARYADPRGWLLGALIVSGFVPVLMFAFGGRRAPAAGEPVAPPSPVNPLAPFTEMAGGPTGNALDSPSSEFDVGDPDIPTLTKLHLGASGAVLGWIGFGVFGSSDDPATGLLGWCHEHGARVCAVLLAVIVVAVMLIGNPHHDAAPVRRFMVRILGFAGIVTGGAAWLAGAVAMLRMHDVGAGQRGVLPGVGRSTQVAMFSGLAALTALVVTCALGALAGKNLAPDGPFRRYLFGMTSPVLAAVGVLLGVGFGAATVFGVRHLLLATVASGQDFVLPPVYRRVAHAWGLTVGELLLVLGCILLFWWRQRATFIEGVRRAHNVDPFLPVQPAVMTDTSGLRHPDDLTPSAIAGVAFAWWTARIKMHVQWIFCVLAVFGLTLTVLTVLATRHDTATECATDGPATWPMVGALVSCNTFGGTALVGIGSLALLGLFTGLIFVGRKSLKDSTTRSQLERGVGHRRVLAAGGPSVGPAALRRQGVGSAAAADLLPPRDVPCAGLAPGRSLCVCPVGGAGRSGGTGRPQPGQPVGGSGDRGSAAVAGRHRRHGAIRPARPADVRLPTAVRLQPGIPALRQYRTSAGFAGSLRGTGR